MTRGKRIALELIGPPFFGAALWVMILSPELVDNMRADGFSPQAIVSALQAVGVIFVFAYLLAGLPSIGYAFAMERLFTRGLSPTSWRMVWLSSMLGGFCGTVIAVVLMLVTDQNPAVAWLIYISTGLAVGFGLGIAIKTFSARNSLPRA
jgi:hypothetical protein